MYQLVDFTAGFFPHVQTAESVAPQAKTRKKGDGRKKKKEATHRTRSSKTAYVENLHFQVWNENSYIQKCAWGLDMQSRQNRYIISYRVPGYRV